MNNFHHDLLGPAPDVDAVDVAVVIEFVGVVVAFAAVVEFVVAGGQHCKEKKS